MDSRRWCHWGLCSWRRICRCSFSQFHTCPTGQRIWSICSWRMSSSKDTTNTRWPRYCMLIICYKKRKITLLPFIIVYTYIVHAHVVQTFVHIRQFSLLTSNLPTQRVFLGKSWILYVYFFRHWEIQFFDEPSVVQWKSPIAIWWKSPMKNSMNKVHLKTYFFNFSSKYG